MNRASRESLLVDYQYVLVIYQQGGGVKARQQLMLYHSELPDIFLRPSEGYKILPLGFNSVLLHLRMKILYINISLLSCLPNHPVIFPEYLFKVILFK